MRKIFLVATMLFLTSCLFAADILKMKLGDFDVTAIKIQSMEHEKRLFRHKDIDKLNYFLKQKDSNLSAINVFYVNTGDHKILFDTGINAKVLAEKLKSINVLPESIDIICITHAHYDHVAGLLNDRDRIFPNATIYVSKEELMANTNLVGFRLYKDRIKIFNQNDKILPYLKTIPAFGHTVGHTMFELTSQGKTMLFWGDIIHAPIQFQDPYISLIYDTDEVKALISRTKVLQEYADTGKYIAGAHLLNCGIGQIQKNKDGSYNFKFLQND